MPKLSEKSKLKSLYKEIFINDLLMLEIFGENDENQRKKEDEVWEEFTLAMAAFEEFRYSVSFVHHSVPKSQHFIQDVLPNLDEKRFIRIARVSRSTFKAIIDLIKDDVVFNCPRSCKQFPLEMQLLIVLYRLGSSGEGATVSKIASLFGVSDSGAIQNMTKRIFHAILKLRTKFVYWPDAAERQNLVSETFHELPHCVGYVDGTEIKLAEKPLDDPEAYFSRKHMYSLKVQAVCDHKLRIRHVVLGYPGNVHSARIYNNSTLTTEASNMLTGAEWLAADSAYKLTSTVITPFRVTSTESNAQQRSSFNRIFSQFRIRIEHCFGLLKERFSSLKELRTPIKDDFSVKFACSWVMVCAILHNILIKQRDDNFQIREDVETDDDEDVPESQNFSTTEGEAKRRALLTLLQMSPV